MKDCFLYVMNIWKRWYLKSRQKLLWIKDKSTSTRYKTLLLSQPRVRLRDFLSFISVASWTHATLDEADLIITFSTVKQFLPFENQLPTMLGIFLPGRKMAKLPARMGLQCAQITVLKELKEIHFKCIFKMYPSKYYFFQKSRRTCQDFERKCWKWN